MNRALVVVVSIFAALLMLAGLGVAGYFYYDVHKDQGQAPHGISMPEQCELVSGETLTKIRTTNPSDLGTSSVTLLDDDWVASCSWTQTRGRDGQGYRLTKVAIEKTRGRAERTFEVRESAVKSVAKSTGSQVAGLGDQATLVVDPGPGWYLNVTYVVRKGDTVVQVGYTGWDAGLFTRAVPQEAEMTAMAKLVVDDVLGKL